VQTPEPRYVDSGDEQAEQAWFGWLQQQPVDELEQIVSRLGNWRPSDNPDDDTQAWEIKYELAVQELGDRDRAGE
jgi:hypothetical protein